MKKKNPVQYHIEDHSEPPLIRNPLSMALGVLSV